MTTQAGPLLLFGSGETAPGNRAAWAALFAHLGRRARVAILETPAGFEPNSRHVAQRVADYLDHRLADFIADIDIIPARQREGDFSTNDPAHAQRIANADLIYAGAGSPTYAVRHLVGSLAWRTVLAAHTRGAALVAASAAAIALGTFALPVYEIFKAGHPLHWHIGLDLFALYGGRTVVVPHWNNREGGHTLDTSHCFMGRARFARLRRMLSPPTTILGLDEHTALFITPRDRQAHVLGKGSACFIEPHSATYLPSGSTIALHRLGWHPPAAPLPWPQGILPPTPAAAPPTPPAHVLALVEERQAARARKDWAQADRLRDEIAAHGWRVLDTPDGPRLEPLNPSP
ncbi:CysS/YqeB C-terminal domain-containing protein [Ardenticatena maritima]|uniref:CysS/YqeB C-terminal domain-containing protein n=3 Tax=Ardenticatena maritima TaxID=872965 RepID=UPI0007619F9E|nr:hypothetical protein [Ardenticatena maritima]